MLRAPEIQTIIKREGDDTPDQPQETYFFLAEWIHCVAVDSENTQLTHTSYNDYEIVADNLFNADHRRVSDRIQAYALYIDPPLGRCGMTDAEIRKSGRRALAAKYPMSQVSRAYEKGETQGFIKICVDAETKQILGAAILGTGGDE